MARYIESKAGLKTLIKRMETLKNEADDELVDFDYWLKVVEGCITDDLAMDEVDYENAPDWFRRLWRGLK